MKKIFTNKWLNSHLRKAYQVSEDSKDESTQVGCIIMTEDGEPRSWGYNGFPIGIDDSIPERNERPLKYKYVCHAERNALDLADCSVKGCVLFVTHHPCSECTRSIIQKKIAYVVIDAKHGIDSDWCKDRDYEDFKISREMLEEAPSVKYVIEHKLE